jgi:hypothetical protein
MHGMHLGRGRDVHAASQVVAGGQPDARRDVVPASRCGEYVDQGGPIWAFASGCFLQECLERYRGSREHTLGGPILQGVDALARWQLAPAQSGHGSRPFRGDFHRWLLGVFDQALAADPYQLGNPQSRGDDPGLATARFPEDDRGRFDMATLADVHRYPDASNLNPPRGSRAAPRCEYPRCNDTASVRLTVTNFLGEETIVNVPYSGSLRPPPPYDEYLFPEGW